MRRIHLLGASIGREWDFPGLAARAALQAYRFEFTAHYAFDKSEALRAILAEPAGPPAAIVLKECAAWFPTDLSRCADLVRGWVERCREAGSVPIPATVVPVVLDGSARAAAARLWRRLRGKVDPGRRLGALLEYNDWLLGFAEAERLAVLDLEAAVRIDESRRSLRPDLHSGDGLHLNRAAYGILDRLVAPTLARAFRNSTGEEIAPDAG